MKDIDIDLRAEEAVRINYGLRQRLYVHARPDGRVSITPQVACHSSGVPGRIVIDDAGQIVLSPPVYPGDPEYVAAVADSERIQRLTVARQDAGQRLADLAGRIDSSLAEDSEIEMEMDEETTSELAALHGMLRAHGTTQEDVIRASGALWPRLPALVRAPTLRAMVSWVRQSARAEIAAELDAAAAGE